MSKKKVSKNKPKRLLGTYMLPDQQVVVGDLKLDGEKTLLRLHSDDFLPPIDDGSVLSGVTYNGDSVTLIDCRSPGTGHTSIKDGPTKYYANVFPHYVALGKKQFLPDEQSVAAIHFTTTDLQTLFL